MGSVIEIVENNRLLVVDDQTTHTHPEPLEKWPHHHHFGHRHHHSTPLPRVSSQTLINRVSLLFSTNCIPVHPYPCPSWSTQIPTPATTLTPLPSHLERARTRCSEKVKETISYLHQSYLAYPTRPHILLTDGLPQLETTLIGNYKDRRKRSVCRFN